MIRALSVLLLVACDPLAGSQVVRTHPCVGNRTDTLWADDVEDLWVGCGSTTDGTGLYTTTDAGRSWQEVPGFDTFRVSHLHRAPDGVLYAAGTEVGGDDRVRAVDGTVIFESTGQVWSGSHVGSFVQLDDGTEIAESLTGAGIGWRTGPDEPWQDGSGWPTDQGSYQILDAVQYEGGVVGVGSTIIQPPTVFVQIPGERLQMQPVGVDPERRGELWSVDAGSSGIVAGGVDQDASVGLVYTLDIGEDPTDPAAWRRLDVSAAIPGDTWIRGVCREGDRVVAVGENPRTSHGILILSIDGGETWQPDSPYAAPALTACDIVGGEIIVVGARGWLTTL